jgi:hypothetical protein
VEVAALVVALIGVFVAGFAWYESRKSGEASERSAAAAEQSAITARQSFEVQQREATAAEQERERRRMADVEPVRWDGRLKPPDGGPRGFVVRNRGQGLAREVRAECVVGNQYRYAEIGSLMPGQSIGFTQELKDFTPDPAQLGELPQLAAGDYAARVWWTNEDGEVEFTDWVQIPRYN